MAIIKQSDTDKRVAKIVKKILSDKLLQSDCEELSKLDFVETQMKRQWDKSKGEDLAPVLGASIWLKIEKKFMFESPKRSLSLWLWSAAACVAVIAVVGGVWLKQANVFSSELHYTEVVCDESKLYYLPDSSKVWMQAGSSIRFPEDFQNNRNVWLTGNSLFEVKKHAGSVFKVHLEKSFIEVKGTTFLVKNIQGEKSKITLFNGSIEFNTTHSTQKIQLKPMQEISYNPENDEINLKSVENMEWKNGKYNFTSISLASLVEVINEMYNSNILLQLQTNAQSAFTGSIRYDEPLEDVISKVCFTLNLKHTKKETEFIIHN